MHDSVMRLLSFARESTANSPKPVNSLGDLRERLGVSSGVFTNWKTRGISKDGAIEAERIFRCSVNWLMTGVGPRTRIGAAFAEPAGAPPPPPRDFHDRRKVSDSDWAVLEAVKTVMSEAEIAEVMRKAKLHQEKVDAEVARRLAAAGREEPPPMGETDDLGSW